MNLLYREEEREMLPYCKDEGIAVIPWSPLARGRLARKWDEATHRQETDVYGKTLYGTEAEQESDRKIVEAVGEIAENKGISRAQVALAWVMQKEEITAPIFGTTKMQHLTDAIESIQVNLSEDEINHLEKAYIPHTVRGAL